MTPREIQQHARKVALNARIAAELHILTVAGLACATMMVVGVPAAMVWGG